MKKAVIITVISFMSISAFAQNDVVTKLFSDYNDDEKFTKVTVSNKMFELFTKIEPGDANEKEILDAISKIQGLKILTADSIANSKKLFDMVVSKINGNGYDMLMEVKDAKENLKFMIKEENGVISELITVVGGNKAFFLMSLYGEIDLKKISKLSKSMNIKGMEYLNNIDKKKKK
jgi:hypothetical protein